MKTIAESAIQFYQKTEGKPWKYWSKIHCEWKKASNGEEFHATMLKPIYHDVTNTASKDLTVYCEDERQVMLCEQVIRMCKGEASEKLDYYSENKWDIFYPRDCLFMNEQYRAAPFQKKELVVPWGWLSSDVTAITVNERGIVLAIDGSNQGWEIKLKLDLTDIELPIIVTRPV